MSIRIPNQRSDERDPKQDQGALGKAAGKQTIGREVWFQTVSNVIPYAKPYWKLLTTSIVVTLGGAAVTLMQPWPLAVILDEVLGQGHGSGVLGGVAHHAVGQGRYRILFFAISAGFVLTLLEGLLVLTNNYVNTKLKLGMVFDFMSDLFGHFQRLSLTFHDQTKKGGLMNRINQAPTSLGDFVASTAPIVQSLFTLVGMLIVAILIDWQVALASLLIVPLLYYQIKAYTTKVIPQLQAVGMLEMGVMSMTLEALQMLRLVLSFGRERHEHQRFRAQATLANQKRLRLTVRQTLFSVGVSVATAAGTALVLGFGAWHVLQGRISVGELVVLIAYIAAVYKPLESLTSTVGSLSEQVVGLGFALEVLKTDPEIVEAPRAKTLARVSGEVKFDDVTFTYPTRERTLESINFDIQAGQRAAIVGPTGSGKSTIVSLMIRFYDPQEGRICIDGVDIRHFTLKSLRDQVSIVLQDPLLFSGTIAENIRYGKLDATDDEVVAAAKAANAHEFISRLWRGYDTPLGERGAQLSGGERQRICIARAFLKDAPILVLDEPTSSIDSKTESVILDALDDLMVGRTSFVIAHRLSTIRSVDRILLMRAGKIVAQGTHDELFARSQLYRELYGVQTSSAANQNGLRARFVERVNRALAQPDEVAERRLRTLVKARGVDGWKNRPGELLAFPRKVDERHAG